MPPIPEYTELARAAGQRLALELDPELEMRVERLLAPNRYESSPVRFDAAGIVAALVVAVAQVAWQIYHATAIREKTHESMARQIRIQVDLPATVTPAERDLVIEAVLAELKRMDPPEAISATFDCSRGKRRRVPLHQLHARGVAPSHAIEQGRMSQVRVLFFAADPASADGGRQRLLLDEDMRAIREKVRAAEFRDALSFDDRWAARPDDLIQAFNETRPQVVHFSGHGSERGLVLVGNHGTPQSVGAPALARLFATFAGTVRVVVLSACHSRAQAQAIVQWVDCVIGTRGALPDEAALAFNASFYRAIAFGCSVREAYDQASVAVSLGGFPDDACPELLARDGVDPARLFLVSPDAAEPRHFTEVRYGRRVFDPFTFNPSDVGTLAIDGAQAQFHGENGSVRIHHVREVKHAQETGGPFNNWVKIRYGAGDGEVAYLSRAGVMNELLGGSDDLYAALRGMMEKGRGDAPE
ncbi:CHAT domain-containing protein [Longimicrobium terrae]|uniref:CHAT domain-containing protein n=1 Tax=Longimicrobium terrae TaxID=1639882 RepID=A0A841GWW4_9BACT|nr:CHAT domain-containing protein [Longimicrobium terrae]MBB4635977.1 hypothetical protein [Longimicrobium terrae]MBB6070373.1 hypothetical protein [Longimicrobium terrae]NNC30870.1 CHAT domain-containing protein [Longimicrobium terrae]